MLRGVPPQFQITTFIFIIMLLIIFLLLFIFPFNAFADCVNTTDEIQGVYFSSGRYFTLEHALKTGVYYGASLRRRDRLFFGDDIGHQGFSIDSTYNHVWTSKKNSPYNGMLYVIDNKLVVRRVTVKFFETYFFHKNEVMPTLSSDNKYLIVRGRRTSREMFFRVFDLTRLNIYKNIMDFIDVSRDYIYQWDFPEKYLTNEYGDLQPLQAIASDGKFVYILLGNSKAQEKAILTFSLSGKFKKYNRFLSLTADEIRDWGENERYEPEGITIVNNRIAILISSNHQKNRKACLYFKMKNEVE